MSEMATAAGIAAVGVAALGGWLIYRLYQRRIEQSNREAREFLGDTTPLAHGDQAVVMRGGLDMSGVKATATSRGGLDMIDVQTGSRGGLDMSGVPTKTSEVPPQPKTSPVASPPIPVPQTVAVERSAPKPDPTSFGVGDVQCTVTVRCEEAKNLADKDEMGHSDPYCSVVWRGEVYRTSEQTNTLNPKWGEDIVLPYEYAIDKDVKTVKIELFDLDLASHEDDALGYVEVPLKPTEGCSWVKVKGENVSGEMRVGVFKTSLERKLTMEAPERGEIPAITGVLGDKTRQKDVIKINPENAAVGN
eukprot:GHVN01015233.1.p1 GENE.GHVN01015233.1~~GHVN01015233.1.p1  ORF type:complete len:304 (+),score=82.18 GHVN01015233.1:48-959(+)